MFLYMVIQTVLREAFRGLMVNIDGTPGKDWKTAADTNGWTLEFTLKYANDDHYDYATDACGMEIGEGWIPGDGLVFQVEDVVLTKMERCDGCGDFIHDGSVHGLYYCVLTQADLEHEIEYLRNQEDMIERAQNRHENPGDEESPF